MIIDSITNLKKYETMHPRFGKAFEFLQALLSEQPADGKYIMPNTDMPEEIFVNVASNVNQPKTEAVAESHKKYIDVQLLIKGAEVMYVPTLSKPAPSTSKGDNYMYEGVSLDDCHRLCIPEGDFVIFFTGELHAPGAATGECEENVRKAVLKVLA